MARVHWPKDALDQLFAIVAYIRMFDPAAAVDVGERLLALGDSLSDFPNRGRPGLHGTRELVMVPPYVLSYDVEGDEMTILSIRHGARLPEGR